MIKTDDISTPATGVGSSMSAFVATRHSAWTAPIATAQGTALPVAGTSAAATTAQVAVAGARSTDLPGSPARGAPV